jgi:hypothetical protein
MSGSVVSTVMGCLLIFVGIGLMVFRSRDGHGGGSYIKLEICFQLFLRDVDSRGDYFQIA